MLAGGRSSDGLRHFQHAGRARHVWREPGGLLVDVHQVHRYHLPRRYGHRLMIAGHGRRDGRGGAVRGLRDGAHRASWDVVETLRHVACVSPGGDDEVRRQGDAVADDVDRDRPLVAGERTGDGLRYEQGAGSRSVGVGDLGGPRAAREGS